MMEYLGGLAYLITGMLIIVLYKRDHIGLGLYLFLILILTASYCIWAFFI
jgi:hypothetical protein